MIPHKGKIHPKRRIVNKSRERKIGLMLEKLIRHADTIFITVVVQTIIIGHVFEVYSNYTPGQYLHTHTYMPAD